MIKKILTITGVALTAFASANAQLSLVDNNPQTQNFDAFAGTAVTVPANFIYSGTDYNPGGFYNRATVYNNSNSTYGLRESSTSSDVAFGSKVGASEGPFTLTLSIINNTGSIITDLDVDWDVEQYSAAFRATTINFSYRVGAGAFGTTGVSGTTLTTATLGATDGVQLASIAVTNRSVSITGLSLAVSGTADLRWTWTTGAGSGGNAHIGIDNVSVTAVPEPSTFGAIALGAASLLGARRIRRKLA